MTGQQPDGMAREWSPRPAVSGDAEWIAELRAVVLRDGLERLGRFDPGRVRQWFLSTFAPGLTSVIAAHGPDIGSITVQ